MEEYYNALSISSDSDFEIHIKRESNVYFINKCFNEGSKAWEVKINIQPALNLYKAVFLDVHIFLKIKRWDNGGPESREPALRQSRAAIERRQPELAFVVDQDASIGQGHAGHMRHGRLEKGEITDAQRPQNQRVSQAAPFGQGRDQALQVAGFPALIGDLQHRTVAHLQDQIGHAVRIQVATFGQHIVQPRRHPRHQLLGDQRRDVIAARQLITDRRLLGELVENPFQIRLRNLRAFVADQVGHGLGLAGVDHRFTNGRRNLGSLRDGSDPRRRRLAHDTQQFRIAQNFGMAQDR